MANDGEKGGREGLPCSPDAPPGLPCSPDAPPSLPCSPDAPSRASPAPPSCPAPAPAPRRRPELSPARIRRSRRRPSCPEVSPARIWRTGPPLPRLASRPDLALQRRTGNGRRQSDGRRQGGGAALPPGGALPPRRRLMDALITMHMSSSIQLFPMDQCQREMGIHLDPSIYLMDEEKTNDNSRMEKKVAESESSADCVEKKTEHQSENGLPENRISVVKEDFAQSQQCIPVEGRINEGLSGDNRHEINSSNSAHSIEKNPKVEGDGHKDLDQQKNNTAKKDKPAAEPIVVPIVLRMSDFDHKALLEEWIATRAFRDNCPPQDHRKLTNNLKLIQDYLCSFEAQGLTIVDISANTFPQTLDWLHSYLLQCIERGLLAACSESSKQGESQLT